MILQGVGGQSEGHTKHLFYPITGIISLISHKMRMPQHESRLLKEQLNYSVQCSPLLYCLPVRL